MSLAKTVSALPDTLCDPGDRLKPPGLTLIVMPAVKRESLRPEETTRLSAVTKKGG